MRFYAIQVSQGIAQANFANISGLADLAAPIVARIASKSVPTAIAALAGAAIGGSQWCSVINGVNDPGALDVEFDIDLNPSGIVNTGWIKIYGIPQSLIAQSSNFTACQVKLYGGFIEGLPLATLESKNMGLLVDALIWPCIGNWTGNELSLTFILQPSSGNAGGPMAPVNIIHNMPKGTPLGTAIQNALNTAFPDASHSINISPKLVLNYDDHGFYQSIEQYANYVKELSHSILGTPEQGYQGVRLDTGQSPFNIFDGTVPGASVQLLYEDLIGQPTWVGATEICVKVALRGDIRPNSMIVLPQNLLTTTTFPGASAFLPGMYWTQYQPGNVLNFQGAWNIKSIRHLGRFRNSNAESNWVTIINAYSGAGQPGGSAVENQSGQHTFTQTGEGSGTGSST